ncbi:hypothetical protein I598_2001 [Isoptericola dokdonensis DS-3]|uniref:GAF domain-containing protein n=1 Tax=Isoptericola dokdonensis DS-3 TaxID=1300344 RepID=A0A161IE20_9MICO|nr:hypothetical protein I598_2001 [Isoptericola dokdonensis DS-3]
MRIAVTLATLASTLALAVRGQINPQLSLWWVFLPLVVAAPGQAVDTIVRAMHTHRAPLREDDRRDIQQLATQALQDVARYGNIDITKVGVCVWVPGTVKPFLWKPRLLRVVRFRLDTAAAKPSDVDWVMGKGTIGEAWRSRRLQHKDWRAIANRHPGRLTDEQWTQIPTETKSGFTQEEFEEVRDKYAEVLAVPIVDSHSANVFYGVLSIDLPMDAVPADQTSRLELRAVQTKAKAAADTVALTLKHRRV